MATAIQSGSSTRLNVTGGAAVLIKDRSGVVGTITVTSAITGAVTVHDLAAASGMAAANLVYQSAATPAVGSIIVLNFPCRQGIVVTPGSAGAVSVSYE
jgi:hypothetical protein